MPEFKVGDRVRVTEGYIDVGSDPDTVGHEFEVYQVDKEIEGYCYYDDESNLYYGFELELVN